MSNPTARRPRALVIAAAIPALISALAVAPPPAWAGGPAQTREIPAAGATFPCTGGLAFITTGGTVTFSTHDSFDATGTEHVTGTVSPNDVTATSNTPGDDTIYRIVGHSWFGGSFSPTEQTGVFTSTDHFEILGPSGGAVATVRDTFHMDRNGNILDHNFGDCSTPGGN